MHDLISSWKANEENRLGKPFEELQRYKLLIIDGWVSADHKRKSKLFFQLIDKRYEQKARY
ncbi:ATP-binding protein [Dubosiella newyorkensis]|uniref:ATP-binding protein n=1 Tax=Dubosiella newyorkensis TaxID=1862672 RepID=UPI003F664628